MKARTSFFCGGMAGLGLALGLGGEEMGDWEGEGGGGRGIGVCLVVVLLAALKPGERKTTDMQGRWGIDFVWGIV